MLRVAVSKVRMPRSHRITCSLPAASRYSAASSRSSTLAARPRFSSTGLPALPTALQQREILHVAGADLKHVGMFGDGVDVGRVHHFGDDRQAELVADLAQGLEALRAVALEASRGWSAACRRRREVPIAPAALDGSGAVRAVCSSVSTAQGPAITAKPLPPIVRLAEADDRVVRVHLAADQLVGRQDRLHRFHHRVAVEAELGEHALVAERAEDDALGAGHVERLQALLLDPREDLVGGFLCGFALENDDHCLGCPWNEGMKKPAGSRRVLERSEGRDSSGYPFVGRAACLAGDQRHHSLCGTNLNHRRRTCSALPGRSTVQCWTRGEL